MECAWGFHLLGFLRLCNSAREEEEEEKKEVES
jgi:hypothetical protein